MTSQQRMEYKLRAKLAIDNAGLICVTIDPDEDYIETCCPKCGGITVFNYNQLQSMRCEKCFLKCKKEEIYDKCERIIENAGFYVHEIDLDEDYIAVECPKCGGITSLHYRDLGNIRCKQCEKRRAASTRGFVLYFADELESEEWSERAYKWERENDKNPAILVCKKCKEIKIIDADAPNVLETILSSSCYCKSLRVADWNTDIDWECSKDADRAFVNKINARLYKSPKIMTEYCKSLVLEGKSYNTIYNYIGYVLQFTNFLFWGYCPEDFYLRINSDDIEEYIDSLDRKFIGGKWKKTSDSIKAVHWTALNSFFQFLIPEYLDENPMEVINRTQIEDDTQIVYLSQEEIREFLKNVEKKAANKIKNRDLCMMKLGFTTGLKSSSILDIDLADIDFENNRIQLKNNDYIEFGENLRSQLLLWISDRQKYFGEIETDALFVSKAGKRLSPDRFSAILNQYAEGVTEKHITPSVMRHSCAMHLLKNTGDIYLCSKQLKHKSIYSSQKYAEQLAREQNIAIDILDDIIFDDAEEWEYEEYEEYEPDSENNAGID